MTTIVTKGNSIYVPAEDLGGADGKEVRINWSQNFKSRTEEYWACKYSIKAGGSGEGVIFIQASKLDEFKAKKIDGEEITVVVDDNFQYGQNKDRTKRFLVFHDKEHKPYQHRFIENLLTQFGGRATDIIASMGLKQIGNVADLAKHFIGDPLRDF